jgi:hypothetical protein
MYNPTVVGEQTEHVAHFHADKLGDRVSGSVIVDASRDRIAHQHPAGRPCRPRRAACTWL